MHRKLSEGLEKISYKKKVRWQRNQSREEETMTELDLSPPRHMKPSVTAEVTASLSHLSILQTPLQIPCLRWKGSLGFFLPSPRQAALHLPPPTAPRPGHEHSRVLQAVEKKGMTFIHQGLQEGAHVELSKELLPRHGLILPPVLQVS